MNEVIALHGGRLCSAFGGCGGKDWAVAGRHTWTIPVENPELYSVNIREIRWLCKSNNGDYISHDTM